MEAQTPERPAEMAQTLEDIQRREQAQTAYDLGGVPGDESG